jgi:stage II sporulation protein AA (anti-sigma F factor antagonist)
MTGIRIEEGSDGEQVRIALAGDIDMTNANDLGERVASEISNRALSVELDLGAVTYIDSAGLRMLSLLAGRLQRLQIELRVIAPPGSPARHVIDLSGMTEYVNVVR